MYWPDGVTLLQNALTMTLWLSLPLLAAIAAAGLVGSYVQSSFGLTDQGALVGARLLAAIIVFAIFGAWMVALMGGYWGALWIAAARFIAPVR